MTDTRYWRSTLGALLHALAEQTGETGKGNNIVRHRPIAARKEELTLSCRRSYSIAAIRALARVSPTTQLVVLNAVS